MDFCSWSPHECISYTMIFSISHCFLSPPSISFLFPSSPPPLFESYFAHLLNSISWIWGNICNSFWGPGLFSLTGWSLVFIFLNYFYGWLKQHWVHTLCFLYPLIVDRYLCWLHILPIRNGCNKHRCVTSSVEGLVGFFLLHTHGCSWELKAYSELG